MSRLTSPSKVRQYALEVLHANRPHLAEKKTRVSKDFLERVEAKTRAYVLQEAVNCCSVGHTVK